MKYNINLKSLFAVLLLISAFLLSTSSLAAKFSYPSEPLPANMQAFIDKMVKEHDFNKVSLTKLFSQAEILPVVIKSIKKPMEKKPWDYYRNFFLTNKRIKGGEQYWQEHAQTLAHAEQVYGVAPNVITAIIGVESLYGKRSAKYQTLGSLATLAFYHKPRAAFFKRELEQFLLLTREYKLDPLSIHGSYAGALGIPQFMPSSYRYYGVSYTEAVKVDLLNNHNDAITSIANYLKKAGWKNGQPVAVPAIIKGKVPSSLISKNARPNTTIGELAKHNVQSPIPLPKDQKAGLIAMHKQNDKQEYWIIFPNFLAIMRYNPRTTYALAVFQLSEPLKARHDQQATALQASRKQTPPG